MMLDWIKQFFIVPLSYLAAVCSIIFIAVEILCLTTWAMVRKGSQAARKYQGLIRGERQTYNPLTDPRIYVPIIVGVLAVLYINQKRSK